MRFVNGLSSVEIFVQNGALALPEFEQGATIWRSA